jgi:hypothetical protein
MRVRSKHVLGALLALLFVGVAHSPLLGAGFVAQDWAALAAPAEPGVSPAMEGAQAEPAPARDPERGPLARGVLQLARDVADAQGAAAAPILRGASLLVYLACVPFLFAYARRLLRPWCGDEQARAAALAASLIFAVHPLAPVAVAAVVAQPELLGLLLALATLATFLAGRQEHSARKTAASLVLALLAGSTAEDALLLPLALCASEFLSANRQRPVRVRLRTAATTLVVFGAAVALDAVLAAVERGTGPTLPASDAFQAWSLATIERLGVIVLPVNPLALGAAGSALAGGVFLLVLQPALVGAQSAPRLWGWVLATWFAALVLAVAVPADLVLAPERFDLARLLVVSIVPLSIGIGVAATALAGMRRWYVTWAAVVGYAIVAHGNARPWLEAGRVAESLRSELASASERHPGAAIFVLDPPGSVRGVEAVGNDLAPLFAAGSAAADAARVRIRTASARAFLELLREPEGARLVDERALVIRPLLPGRGYEVVELSRGPPSGALRTWRDSLASPPLDWDPLEIGALRVTTQAGAELVPLDEVEWRAKRSASARRDSCPGAWVRKGGESTGLFDLGSSIDWRLGGRVRSVFFREARQSIGTAEALADLPTLGELLPLEEGEDWVFHDPRPAATAGPETYVLCMLDVERLEWREFAVRTEGNRLVAPGVVPFARERHGRVAWRLEQRALDLALARTRGRA